ncbi:MAG: MotA/TolQ/ExbB proton channel family protein [Kiritimatiellia bacterium]
MLTHIRNFPLRTASLCWAALLTPAAIRARETATNPASEVVEVNWLQEMLQGGGSMLALAVVSVFLVAFTIERLISLRTGQFIPPKMTDTLAPLLARGEEEAVNAQHNENPCTLTRMARRILSQRGEPFHEVQQSVLDLLGREISRLEQRNVPFSVIAAVAPLLGLLGTMIGMIESFKLVEVFGDEGGASMLAGSISKALITTAGGLVLAIPSVILYYTFRNKVHGLENRLEEEAETLLRAACKQKVQD